MLLNPANHRINLPMVRARLANPSAAPSSRWLIGAVFLVSGLLMVTNVWLSAELSHQGLRLNILTEKMQSLAQASEKMQSEVVLSTSLTDLHHEALKLGYSKEVTYLNLPDTHTVALKP